MWWCFSRLHFGGARCPIPTSLLDQALVVLTSKFSSRSQSPKEVWPQLPYQESVGRVAGEERLGTASKVFAWEPERKREKAITPPPNWQVKKSRAESLYCFPTPRPPSAQTCAHCCACTSPTDPGSQADSSGTIMGLFPRKTDFPCAMLDQAGLLHLDHKLYTQEMRQKL